MRRTVRAIVVVVAVLVVAPTLQPEAALATATSPASAAAARALTARQGTASTGDPLLPAGSAMFPFSVNAIDHDAIKVGDVTYPNRGPKGTIQFLVLDRSTLKPYRTGNSWCCDSGTHSLDITMRTLKNLGLNQLVIFTLPFGRGPNVLPSSQWDEFEKVLALIGVGPLQNRYTYLDPNFGQQVVFVGIPSSGAGSGWAMRRDKVGLSSDPFPIQGWLMPDGTLGSSGLNLRFQPVRAPFQTRAALATNGNIMTIAGQSVTSMVPAGTSGFQVVLMDQFDLKVVSSNAYATNANGPQGLDFDGLAQTLQGAKTAENYVAVQSIGNPGPCSSGVCEHIDGWNKVADALAALGANPHLFTTLDTNDHTRYAFTAGPPYARADALQSNSSIVVDPTTTPITYEAGFLSGHLRMGHDGVLSAVPENPASASQALDDVVLTTSSKPWPHSAAAGDPDARAYDSALDYIKSRLPSPWSGVKGSLRNAYVDYAATLDFGDAATKLDQIVYPNSVTTCPASGPPALGSSPRSVARFTLPQFCTMIDDLKTEFGLLSTVKTQLAFYKSVFSGASGNTLVDLKSLGAAITKDITPPPGNSFFTSLIKLLLAVAVVVTGIFGGGVVVAAVGLMISAYDMAGALGTNGSKPIGDQISATVSNFADRIQANAQAVGDGLDNIRTVANSDYGRLSSIAAKLPAVPTPDVKAFTGPVTSGADRFFAEQLMPIAFGVSKMQNLFGGQGPKTPKNCEIGSFGFLFSNAPDVAWISLNVQVNSPQSFVVTDRKSAEFPPLPNYPSDVLGEMFKPPSQSGYGIEKSTWFWTQQSAITFCGQL